MNMNINKNILLDKPIRLDLEAAIANIRRQDTPSRVFHFEHGLEEGQKQSLCERFGLPGDLDKADPYFRLQREICVHQFQETMCQFSRCAAINVGDDMGHRLATLIDPDDIREFFVPWQKRIIDVAHVHEKVVIFHVCGQVEAIMDDLIDTVGIDAKHSTQDAIEPITVAKQRWGERVGLLGGIDVDFLTRAQPDDVRPYVRNILDACMPGGEFALGVGNLGADTIPTENYLAVHAEARSFV